MTKKQFKEALLRGQGRCIQAVRKNPDKYYSVIMWACSHEIAFDPQCEGTRSLYMYKLINCYSDITPFIDTLISALRNSRSDGGWKMLYLTEILSFFAMDGIKNAEEALWTKYEELYSLLFTKKRCKSFTFPEADDFAMLCEVLAINKSSILRITEDIGRLYLEKNFYREYTFDWLYEAKAKRYMPTLKKQSQNSENIAEFLHISQYTEEERERNYQSRKEISPDNTFLFSLWLKRKANSEKILHYANAYLAQTNPKERAKALKVFCRCPFPKNPLPIIQDAQSDCNSLKEAAWMALENIRHPLVYEFAKTYLQIDVETALPIFITNYQDQDKELLIHLVTSIPTDFKDDTIWHQSFLDVLGMKDNHLKPPAAILYHIYETSYCSCCRNNALRQMGRRRLLTDDILQECLLDSDEDIRSYAKKVIKRRT